MRENPNSLSPASRHRVSPRHMAETCPGMVTDGHWRAGRWHWRHAEECGFHAIKPSEARELLAGRHITLLGNSIVRRTMYSLVDALLGTERMLELTNATGTPDTSEGNLFDRQCHDAMAVVVDLKLREFHRFSARHICHMPESRQTFEREVPKRNRLAGGGSQDVLGLAMEWVVQWPLLVEAADQHQVAARAQEPLEHFLRRSLPSGAELLSLESSSSKQRPRGEWPRIANATSLSARLRVDLRVLKQRLSWEGATGRVYIPSLSAWAVRPCESTLRCTGPTRVTAETATLSEYNPDAWKCSGVGYESQLQRMVSKAVPSSHPRVLFSHTFSWWTVENGQLLHLCREWDESSVGSGADMFVLRPTARAGWTRDFLSPLRQERTARAESKTGCFSSHARQVPAVVQSWLPPFDYRLSHKVNKVMPSPRDTGKMHAHFGATSPQAAYELRQQNLTSSYPLDLTEAVASAVRHNATTRIQYLDNIHLNPVGRRFTAQILLNLIRLLLPRHRGGTHHRGRLWRSAPEEGVARRSRRR